MGEAEFAAASPLRRELSAPTEVWGGPKRGGEAAAYYACAEERYAILRDDTVRDAVLPAFPCYPDLLYYDDFMPNADDWRNGAGAHYYCKDSIRVG